VNEPEPGGGRHRHCATAFNENRTTFSPNSEPGFRAKTPSRKGEVFGRRLQRPETFLTDPSQIVLSLRLGGFARVSLRCSGLGKARWMELNPEVDEANEFFPTLGDGKTAARRAV